MGIYSCSDGSIYGAMMTIFPKENDDAFQDTILFEAKYDVAMNNEQKMEAQKAYDKLTDKKGVKYYVYIQCCSTYADISFLNWWPVTEDHFLLSIQPSFTKHILVCDAGN
jgi:hypothetical protein